jgi:internalin A
MTLEELKDNVKNAIERDDIDSAFKLMEAWSLNYGDQQLSKLLVTLKKNWIGPRTLFQDKMIEKRDFQIHLRGMKITILNLLSSINITVLQIIREAKESRATRLDLGNCGLIVLPHELFELTWLEELILHNDSSSNIGEANNIKSLSYKFPQLEKLKILNIAGSHTSKWSLKDLKPLDELVNLQELYVSNTLISDLSPLKKLLNLQVIDIHMTRVTDLSPLQSLHKLETLHLYSTEVDNLKPIENLVNLRHLQIDYNEIADLGPLRKLVNLEELIATGNALIRDLSPLKNLKKLQVLDVSETEIIDFEPLKDLYNLQDLTFMDTGVSDLTPLQNLKELRSIDFKGTKVSDLTPLKDLVNLQGIYAIDCNIDNLSPLQNLKNLRDLCISHNNVSDLTPLKGLTNLFELSFSYCQVSKLEPIKDLNLEILISDNNPIEDCPKEVYETDDIQQIRAYFNQNTTKKTIIIQEKAFISNLQGVKLVFLGNAAVGKTQFVEYITTSKYNPERLTTHGILINNWQVQNPDSLPIFQENLTDMMVNIWDFGGQEYYHGTHRLFLSNRAVYVLLFDKETNVNGQRPTLITDDEQVDLEHFNYHYWLDSVRAFAPDSPILMLQNKIDVHTKIRLNREDFDDYAIRELHHVSLLEGAKQGTPQYKIGLERSFYDLAQLLAEEGSKTSFPNWLPIVDELRKVRDNALENAFLRNIQHKAWVSRDDFKAICEKILDTQLTDDEIHTLPRWLNNTGEILFFADNSKLNDRVFINPTWVTDTIYEILDKTVKAEEGKFSKAKLVEQKSEELATTILAMMVQMDIIFQLKNEVDTFIAPQYLADKHPIEDLYKMVEKGLNEQAVWVQLPLFFYKKLMHHLLMHYGTHEKVETKYYWKHGIVLLLGDVRVLIKGLYPSETENEGKILIGVEPHPKAKEIQKEVFRTILKVLFNTFTDNAQFNSKGLKRKVKRIGMEGDKFVATDLNYSDEDFLNEDIKSYIHNREKKTPRWLKHLNISVNGEDFVNYLSLCQHSDNKSTSAKCVIGDKMVKVSAFSAFLSNKGEKPLKVFFSYSHNDTDLMQRLHIHLAPLRRMDRIATWSDREILPGSDWDSTIKDNLRTADVILLLLSADFVASEYIWHKELAIIKERKAKGEKFEVLPILLRPMDYSILDESKFEMMPKDESGKLKAVSLWADKENALAEIAKKIKAVIETL